MMADLTEQLDGSQQHEEAKRVAREEREDLTATRVPGAIEIAVTHAALLVLVGIAWVLEVTTGRPALPATTRRG